jgi:hypothetical protein
MIKPSYRLTEAERFDRFGNAEWPHLPMPTRNCPPPTITLCEGPTDLDVSQPTPGITTDPPRPE